MRTTLCLGLLLCSLSACESERVAPRDDVEDPPALADAGQLDAAQQAPDAGDARPPDDDASLPARDAATDEDAATDQDGGTLAFDAPASADELEPFLREKRYADWAAEPAYHASSGPHGGGVRVFYGPRARAALERGAERFPEGAAVVKELSSEGYLYGWAVWTKVQNDSDEGRGFYWYEIIGEGDDAVVYGDGLGHEDCVDCHAPGRDYLLSAGTFE